jgi:aminoglycoside phosphotransferase (APT) family kinase protein
MRLKNVMVDEAGKITAVIDWEFCSSNVAPYWDLALHDLSVDAKQAFLGGYGVSEGGARPGGHPQGAQRHQLCSIR